MLTMKSLGFVYVPKTGGTYLSIGIVPIGYEDGSSEFPPKVHMPASVVQSITKDKDHIFTMVRDPYDRACSEYYFLKSKATASIKDFSWNTENKRKLETICNSVADITGYKFFSEKTCVIYDNDMSVEDYLEWSIDNPTYPLYYDTLEPKDFDLIGVTEDLPKTIGLLKSIYDIDAGYGDLNKNIDKPVSIPYTTKFSRSDFKSKNKIEYELYYQGLDRFLDICNNV